MVAEEEEGEEDVSSLIRKKSRKGDQAEAEREPAGKCRKKERAIKAEHEQSREPREEEAEETEKNKVAVDVELPITPSMEILEATTSAPIDVKEMEKPSRWQEEDTKQRPYASDWTIYPGTQLKKPLIRAEWVARALSPAKIVTYLGAQMFNICDIVNRAAVLVGTANFFF